MKVHILFKARFEKPLLDGTKTWTTRSRPYGKAGDTFDAFEATFIIDTIDWKQLGEVAAHWKEEGCESMEDFIDVWCEIHPRVGYRPDSYFCVHIFHKKV